MRVLLVPFMLVCLSSQAQLKSFIIGVKGDTLNRVDMKGLKQGPWVNHMEELRGEPGYDEQGYYTDGKKDGVWVRFSLMGDKQSAETYRWGALDGKSQYFNRQGGLVREENWRAVDPNKTYDTVDVVDIVDPNKVIDRVVVKLEGQSMKHGTWTYYDPEWGTITKTEDYFMNKLRNGADGSFASEDDVQPINPVRAKDGAKVEKPQAILDYEKKNSKKKKYKEIDGRSGN